MKICQVILLVFLIIKSSVGMNVAGFFGSNCHDNADQVELSLSDQDILDVNSEDEKKGCCGDDELCDCVCCGHIFDNNLEVSFQIYLPKLSFFHKYDYKENYHSVAKSAIWQPPRIV